MKAYHELLQKILDTGVRREDRTGVGTIGIFGAQIRFNLREGFPLLATKKTPFRLIAEELFWFLRGETNIQSLLDKNVHIWDEWADKDGNLGRVYGAQWRSWRGVNSVNGETVFVDQIAQLIRDLKDPKKLYSRRHIVSAWNAAEIDEMALPPCHTLFQFYVDPPLPCITCDGRGHFDAGSSPGAHDIFTEEDYRCHTCLGSGRSSPRLSCQLYQRSADMFLGVPFNIASYALLTHLVAHVTGLEVGDFVHTFGDAHIYLNHLDQVRELLSREIPESSPTLHVLCEPKADPADYSFADIEMVGYEPLPAIKADVAV